MAVVAESKSNEDSMNIVSLETSRTFRY